MDDLHKKWDGAAEKIDFDPMRSIRYGAALRYIGGMDKSVKILEVGCGEGTGLFILHWLGFKNLSGVEISPERINRARKKVPAIVELEVIEPDLPLPYDDESFDVVITLAVIEHTVFPDNFIDEIARVLKKGGRAVVSSDCITWRYMQLLRLYKSVQPIDKALPIWRFKKMFREKGFQVVHFDTFHLPERKSPFLFVISAIMSQCVSKCLGMQKGNAAEIEGSTCTLNSALQEAVLIGNGKVNYSWHFRIIKYLLNLIDDENVFLVRKN